MRVLIVDDESLAREELRYLLASYSQLEIVGEAENIDQAEEKISQLSPDLLLLDINMPGGSGFDLLERLTLTPAVIFTTAYTEYALQAFEVNALDYLVKPIEETRLQEAINKAREQFNNAEPAQVIERSLTSESKIFLKDNDRCWLQSVEDIIAIHSIGNYSKVCFLNGSPMIKRSLTSLDQRLPQDRFIRANRQCLVNVNCIDAVEAIENSQLLVTLSNGEVIEMSRRQSQLLREFMSL